jgi:hypothetical protein
LLEQVAEAPGNDIAVRAADLTLGVAGLARKGGGNGTGQAGLFGDE